MRDKANRFFKMLMTLNLAILMILTQFNVNADVDTKVEAPKINHATMINQIIDHESTELNIESGSTLKDIILSVQLKVDINQGMWEQLMEYNEPLQFNYPGFFAIQNQEVQLFNTQDQIDAKEGLTFEDIGVFVQKNQFEIDFRNTQENPKSFLINFRANLTGDLPTMALDKVGDKAGFDIIKKDLVSIVNSFLKEEVKAENETRDDNIKKPVTNQPVDQPNAQDDTGHTTQVSGDIKIELKDQPKLKLSKRDTVNGSLGPITKSNPIVMSTYSETRGLYAFDMASDAEENGMRIVFKVVLDQASIDSIDFSLDESAYDFVILEDGKQVPFKYEYAFPKEMQMQVANSDEMAIGEALADVMYSRIAKNKGTSEPNSFKLLLDESILRTGDDNFIEDVYQLQALASMSLSAFIKDQLDNNVSVEAIKASLKNGVEFANDFYVMTEFMFVQPTKAVMGAQVNFNYVLNNFLGMGKNINETFDVRPVGGSVNDLQAGILQAVPNGFITNWSGSVNTNRTQILNTLDLEFVAPPMISYPSIENWNIKTTVNMEYFKVLNNGTLESTGLTEEIVSESFPKISIHLLENEYAVKYTVMQEFISDSFVPEMEGRQVFSLSSKLNQGYAVKKELIKIYPASIDFKGQKLDESSPTTLLWDIVYNNNEIIRPSGSGFEFSPYQDSFKLFEFDSDNDKYGTAQALTAAGFQMNVTINGKAVAEDDRFDVVIDPVTHGLKVTQKEGAYIDEKVKFSVRLAYIGSEENGNPSAKDILFKTPKMKISALANVVPTLNGNDMTSAKNEQEASNELVLFDKRPIMIDYRTNEIVWGVTINTVTAQRIDLNLLTLVDTLGEGLKIEQFNNDTEVILLQADFNRGTDYFEYSSFVNKVSQALNDKQLYAKDAPDKIREILNSKIYPNDTDGPNKDVLYKDRFFDVLDEDIFNTSSKAIYTDQPYILSYPKFNEEYMENMPNKIIDSGSKNSQKKSDLVKGADLRWDFVLSNSKLDNKAYYFLYKTKMSNDAPVKEATNSAGLVYANKNPGDVDPTDEDGWKWSTIKKNTKTKLKDPAMYNSAPKKTGTYRGAQYDETTGRSRHLVEWETMFNFDNHAQKDVGAYTAKLSEVIDKSKLVDGYTANNKDLSLKDLDILMLQAYSVSKDGNLQRQPNKDVSLSKAAGDYSSIDNENEIRIEFEVDLDPEYVYGYIFKTFVNYEQSKVVHTPGKAFAQVIGAFDNTVYYSMQYENGGYGSVKSDNAKASSIYYNRVIKVGYHNASSTKSNQLINWKLLLNESREPMKDIVIKDNLDSKQTFNQFEPGFDLNGESGFIDKPILDGLTVKIKNSNNQFIETKDFKLTNINGDELGLDNWLTGESGFIIKFDKEITNEIEIRYDTYGQIVDRKDSPLRNYINLQYTTTGGRTVVEDIVAQATVSVSGTSNESYDNNTSKLSLTLRYDENKVNPTDSTLGDVVKEDGVTNTYVILYRFQKDNVVNHKIYRIGKLDADGNVVFDKVESGEYMIKQYNTVDEMYIPDELAYAVSDRDTKYDKSIPITGANKGNLVYVKVENESGDEDKVIEASIYNKTPQLTLKKNGKLNVDNLVEIESIINKKLVLSNLEKDWIREFVTDFEGKVVIGHGKDQHLRLKFGTYTLTTPKQDLDGYLRNTAVEQVVISKNPNGSLKYGFDNINFSLYKVDVKISNVLAKESQTDDAVIVKGSEFVLERKEGTEWLPAEGFHSAQFNSSKGIFASDDGILNIANLNVGQYRLRQVNSGHVDGTPVIENPNALEFYAYTQDGVSTDEYLNKPDPMVYEFYNYRAYVTFKNVIDAHPIMGSEFAIYTDQDVLVENFTITDKDAGYSQYLAPGEYYIQQTAITLDRPLNKKPLRFEVNQDNSQGNGSIIPTTVVFENHLGSFNIETYSNFSANFDIEDMTRVNNGTEVSYSDANFNQGLAAGVYSFKDIEIENLYIFILRDYSIEIPETYLDASELKVTLNLYATQAKLSYLNQDGDTKNGVHLTGGQFELVLEDQTRLDPIDGVFKYLSPGMYTLGQNVAPSGYGLNTETVDNIVVPVEIDESQVNIGSDDTVSLYELEDQIYYNYRGKVRLTKVSGETQDVLKGVTFDLYKGNQLHMSNLITDDQGLIEVGLLSPGDYSFRETKSDGIHVIDPELHPFTVVDSSEGAYDVVQVGVLNYYADIIFKNTDPNYSTEYFDGEFSLLQYVEGEWKVVTGFETIITSVNDDGDTVFRLEGIKVGKYQIRQTKAPKGTLLNSKPHEFEVESEIVKTSGKSLMQIELDPFINYKANISVDVIDSYGTFTKGAVLELVDDKNVKLDLLSKVGQYYTIDGLEPGNYALILKDVEGAIIIDNRIDVVIPEVSYAEQNLGQELTARVTYALYNFSLVDGNQNMPLGSGRFDLHAQDVNEKVFIDNGQGEIHNLKPGDYTLTQKVAADGYILNTLNSSNFKVEKQILADSDVIYVDGYPYVSIEGPVFENYKQNIFVVKSDNKNNLLQDVEFTLSNGTFSETRVTDAKGETSFDQLSPGIYELTETRGLAGFMTLDSPIRVEIISQFDGNPDDIILKIVNQKAILPSTGMGSKTHYLPLSIICFGFLLVIKQMKKKQV